MSKGQRGMANVLSSSKYLMQFYLDLYFKVLAQFWAELLTLQKLFWATILLIMENVCSKHLFIVKKTNLIWKLSIFGLLPTPPGQSGVPCWGPPLFSGNKVVDDECLNLALCSSAKNRSKASHQHQKVVCTYMYIYIV